MDNQIFFIIIGSDQWVISENICYLNNLVIPENISAEYMVLDSDSIPQALDTAMNESAAKYKVYMDENVFITDKNFLTKALKIFNEQPDIGMLGVKGFSKESDTGKMKVQGHYVYRCNDITMPCMKEVYETKNNGTLEVMALDKHFMMTSVDTKWYGDSNNFNIIKSVGLRNIGYRTAILMEEKASVLFDNGILGE